ncbi:MAG TPA: arginase [Gammaproteobacteria bacterium]|nr:arginase [Gammaproteobacteria bacterium]
MSEPALIGVASGLGAPDGACADGPVALCESPLLAALSRKGCLEVLRPLPADAPRAALAGLCRTLAARAAGLVRGGARPVVVGGDHSCAVGTWAGVHAALDGAPLGLIWVDAHMDAHTPATSPSGALHGMPLAVLLGFGETDLTTLAGSAPVLQAEHVCVVGVRSYEPEEAALLSRLGVKVVFARELRQRGWEALWPELETRVARGTAGYGISIDLDAIDPSEAPGVGTPVGSGLSARALLDWLGDRAADPRLLAVEMSEYNPHRDRGELTLKLLVRMIHACCRGGRS